MSQEKAQLIAPQGHFTVPGLNVAGVVTASSFSGNCTGTASSITKGSNVVVGVMTASSFAGDVFGNAAGLSTTTAGLKLGIVTATSFAGNFTGIGSGLTGTPNIVAGLVTASQFVGNTPGLAAGISAGKNLAAGIVTATTFYGSGADLDGVSSGPVAQQAVTANGATTTIDLSSGNLIYMTQSANTTVAFANTEGNTDVVYLIRTKDDNTTERTITWPSGVVWDGGTEPTIIDVNATDDYHVFKLTTRDNGATWYGKEVFKNKWGGELYTWGGSWSGSAHGGGGYGYLGHNNATQYSSPTQLAGTGWSVNATTNGEDNKSFVGEYHAGAIKTDGTLWVWGYNDNGQLGDNSTVNKSSPVQIPGTTWRTLHYGGYNNKMTGAIKTDGTLWTWGQNTYWHGGNPVGSGGQLGLSDKTSRSSPTQVPGTTWKNVMLSGTNGGGTKTDGTLWAWGRNNDHGQLGQNSVTDTNSPVQVGSGTDWKSIYGGGDTAQFYIKTDGTLWGVGSAQFGINTGSLTRSSPVQIPGTTWQKVNQAAGSVQVMGLKTDGTLWGWGSNFYGSLGQNTTNSPDNNWISSPVQIPGTNWSDISNYYHMNVATKTDGTLWAWGTGTYLDLEQGGAPANTQYSSPVQIPGAWSQGLSGNQMIMALKQ